MVNVNGYNGYDMFSWWLISIWLVVSTYPSQKYEFVSWDDEIPNIWKNNPNVPNHQPVPDFGAILEPFWS